MIIFLSLILSNILQNLILHNIFCMLVFAFLELVWPINFQVTTVFLDLITATKLKVRHWEKFRFEFNGETKQWWRYNHESCSWLKGSPLIIPTHYQKVWSLVVQKGYNLTVFTSWQMKENKMFPEVDLFCAVTNQSKLCSSDDRTLINFLYQDRTHLFVISTAKRCS